MLPYVKWWVNVFASEHVPELLGQDSLLLVLLVSLQLAVGEDSQGLFLSRRFREYLKTSTFREIAPPACKVHPDQITLMQKKSETKLQKLFIFSKMISKKRAILIYVPAMNGLGSR